MKSLSVFFLIVILFNAYTLIALTPSPSAREDSMGNAHPALADDFSSVFSNPAGMVGLDPVVRFAGLDIRVSGTFWKMANVFSGGDPSELFPLDDGSYIGLGIMGPVDVGYAGDGKAFRLKTYATLDALYPNLAVQSNFAFRIGAQFSGGWGTRFEFENGTLLDLGFMAKGFHEQRYIGEADVVEFFGLLEEPEYFLDMPFEVVPGFGIDASMMARFGKRWIVGVTVEDFLTLEFVNYYDKTQDALDGEDPDIQEVRVPIPEISIGGSWHPVFFDRWKWFGITGVYLSYRNLLGGLETYPVNYLLGITAGTEITFWKFLALRFGFSEGMLSGGVGFRIGGVTMDMLVRGEEISNQPGVFSVIDLRVAFGIETRPGKAIR